MSAIFQNYPNFEAYNCSTQLRVEAHLLDFSGDLYGQELEVTFVEKLREERRFPSLEALRQQIVQDIDLARKRFAVPPAHGSNLP